MRYLDPHLRFLHCLPKIDYLVAALRNGLMLTDHKVEFKAARDATHIAALVEGLLPLIRSKLDSLGLTLETLPAGSKQNLFAGLGFVSADIPMICFTEVPHGKNLDQHRSTFGGFGIVPKNSWALANDAERIIYAGQNSPASKALFKCIATMHILGLHSDQNGQLLFNTVTHTAALPMLAYVESRENVWEAEWRIAGKTGFLGEKRNTGTTIPLPIQDIDYIFVPSFAEHEIQNLVDELSFSQGANSKPKVLQFPHVMPA